MTLDQIASRLSTAFSETFADWGTIFKILMQGIGYTLAVFAVTIVLSIPLGLLLTFASRSRIAPLRWLTRGYVFVIRGTPLMLQLFFVYFGLPFLPVIGPYLKLGRLAAANIAFVLNYAAYFCEIFRGGLLSIDRGQYEAAKVLGFGRFRTMMQIILPQMIKVALPSVANETITLVKDTALVSVIGLSDLMELSKKLVNSMVNVTPYIIAAMIYLVLIFGLTKLFEQLEKKAAY
ncbi:MAG: amino acid ABC transporter permease [Clostridia bacterium]|nr:amino acid ABC transporter permease [Clostridia bacterium]